MEKSDLLPQLTGHDEIDKIIQIAGYSYDIAQDIFISTMNPWQRSVGYCRLYDDAAAPLGMIIDTEPIYFEYQEKKWMIGLWKGQYDLVTGGEIGVYIGAYDLNIPGIFTGTFYNCANDDELLPMSYVLKKNGKTLFTREGKHWWLTGFKLGLFSEPIELIMEISITLKDSIMCDAFVNGLITAGYTKKEITINENTVSFTFNIPHAPQPFTRTPETDWLIQRKNEELCKLYQEITKESPNILDKLNIIQEQAPEVYNKLITIGKNKRSYEMFISIIMTAALLLSFKLSKDNAKDSLNQNTSQEP